MEVDLFNYYFFSSELFWCFTKEKHLENIVALLNLTIVQACT